MDNPTDPVFGSNPELVAKIMIDAALRKAIVFRSHLWFFGIYFYEYLKYPMAGFHYDIFGLTQNRAAGLTVLAAFRGCGKTTIVGQSFPIWAVVGQPRKKYVLIVSKTMEQARQHFRNIKSELENNELLKRDLGPFYDESEEWKSYSLVIPRYNARITAASSEQSIRGTKHGSARPDLIILDDVEDLESVKTMESRNKTYQWFAGDIVPAGDVNTQTFLIGNMLHQDSLIMRCKDDIASGRRRGVYRGYPLLGANGEIAWPGKFPDATALDTLKRTVGDNTAWLREYLLRIVPDGSQVIHREWIHYYDEIGQPANRLRYIATGVDPAISKSAASDYTAIVSAKIYGQKEGLRIFILPNPINNKIDFPETVHILHELSKALNTRLLIEAVAYQKALADQLRHEGISAEEVKIGGLDKRARLVMISHLIESGKILFPRRGAEELVTQLIGFGAERHDDLVDALTLLVNKVIEEDRKWYQPEIWIY